MATPQLTPEQITQVSALVAQYLSAQRERFLPQAHPMTPVQQEAMSGFFTAELLQDVRVVVLDGKRVENPPFYPLVQQMGFTNLPDFSLMAAVTFCDVVVSHEPFTAGLLFHELVHVEQYRQLGIPRFAQLYVRGFLTGGGYDGIPLEGNAYELDGRFQSDPQTRFSVEEEVAAWIRADRF